MDVDISIESIHSDDINQDDFNMDLDDLVGDSPSPASKPPSPIKRTRNHFPKSASYMNLDYKPKLAPIINQNPVTNELFQVTSNLRKLHHREQERFEFEINDNDFVPIKRLTNDKIEKLVNDLGMNDMDYELDDQLRARFRNGRFMRQDENKENDLENHVSHYLQDNQENYSYPDPLKKINKSSENSIIKKRNHLKPKKFQSNHKSQIPILKPLTNLTNLNKDYQETKFSIPSINSSPKRICSPKHRFTKPNKPAMKYLPNKTNIFVVDSSTGLINDATIFGTELNASNCDDFPLPENINEVVQIPTNDDKNKSKIAIIKVFHNKYYNSDLSNKLNSGFYNQQQFETWENNRNNSNGVEVLTSSNDIDKSKSKVHWAEELEW